MQVTNCKHCNVKIIDTSYRPQKIHDECAECEAKQVAPIQITENDVIQAGQTFRITNEVNDSLVAL